MPTGVIEGAQVQIMIQFQETMARARAGAAGSSAILAELRHADEEMLNMLADANATFDLYGERRISDAGAAMSRMDRHYERGPELTRTSPARHSMR